MLVKALYDSLEGIALAFLRSRPSRLADRSPNTSKQVYLMIRKPRLFTPGPTPLLPEAQAALSAPALHHRTADFRKVLDGVRENLKYFYGTANDVIFFTSSGTGAMEVYNY